MQPLVIEALDLASLPQNELRVWLCNNPDKLTS
jgi:hypothetical protein